MIFAFSSPASFVKLSSQFIVASSVTEGLAMNFLECGPASNEIRTFKVSRRFMSFSVSYVYKLSNKPSVCSIDKMLALNGPNACS